MYERFSFPLIKHNGSNCLHQSSYLAGFPAIFSIRYRAGYRISNKRPDYPAGYPVHPYKIKQYILIIKL
jgi:hypothetical protein